MKEEVLKKPERYVRKPVTTTTEIKEQIVEPPSRYAKHMAEMNPPPRKRKHLILASSKHFTEPERSKPQQNVNVKKHSALLQRMLESEQGSFGMSTSGKSAFNPEREAMKERKDK